jgi:hypothetical protein
MKHESQFRREVREPDMPGNLFTRSLTARTIASLQRRHHADVAGEMWPNDRALMQLVTRATSTSATTFTTGWAAELVHKLTADTLAAMGAASGAAEVMKQCLTLNWDGSGIIVAPGFVASSASGGFVKEGDPIPVRQLVSAAAQLFPYKLATIAALTREMADSANAEALISDALVRSAALALDAVFFSAAAAVANTSPAGITNGISATTASTNTDLYEAFAEDVSNLINAVSAVGGNGPYILIANPGRIATITTHYISFKDEEQFQLVASTAVGTAMMAIAPQALVAAISAEPEVQATDAATLVMDTAPGAAGTTGSGEKEMWQTSSIAVKVRWPVSWALRDSRAVAWLTPTWK